MPVCPQRAAENETVTIEHIIDGLGHVTPHESGTYTFLPR
jgi:hypothetical protein